LRSLPITRKDTFISHGTCQAKAMLPQGDELTAQQLQSRNGNAQSHDDQNE